MNDQQFWNYIERSEGDMSKLVNIVKVQSISDIREFSEIAREKLDALELDHLYKIIDGLYSDDGFIDFRTWVISKGEQFYKEVKDPNWKPIKAIDTYEGYGTYVSYDCFEFFWGINAFRGDCQKLISYISELRHSHSLVQHAHIKCFICCKDFETPFLKNFLTKFLNTDICESCFAEFNVKYWDSNESYLGALLQHCTNEQFAQLMTNKQDPSIARFAAQIYKNKVK